jgi:hypothetical protein
MRRAIGSGKNFDSGAEFPPDRMLFACPHPPNPHDPNAIGGTLRVLRFVPPNLAFGLLTGLNS